MAEQMAQLTTLKIQVEQGWANVQCPNDVLQKHEYFQSIDNFMEGSMDVIEIQPQLRFVDFAQPEHYQFFFGSYLQNATGLEHEPAVVPPLKDQFSSVYVQGEPELEDYLILVDICNFFQIPAHNLINSLVGYLETGNLRQVDGLFDVMVRTNDGNDVKLDLSGLVGDHPRVPDQGDFVDDEDEIITLDDKLDLMEKHMLKYFADRMLSLYLICRETGKLVSFYKFLGRAHQQNEYMEYYKGEELVDSSDEELTGFEGCMEQPIYLNYLDFAQVLIDHRLTIDESFHFAYQLVHIIRNLKMEQDPHNLNRGLNPAFFSALLLVDPFKVQVGGEVSPICYESNVQLWGPIHRLSKFEPKFVDGQSVFKDLGHFMADFERFTCGMFEGADWNNIVMAGGSMDKLMDASLTEYPESSDIDIFIFGETSDIRKQKVHDLLHFFESKYQVIYGIRGSVIDLLLDGVERMVQIICTCMTSGFEIINNFDVSNVQVMFDGQNVWMTLAALMTCKYQTTSFSGTPLPRRLAKSLLRGYQIRKYDGQVWEAIPFVQGSAADSDEEIDDSESDDSVVSVRGFDDELDMEPTQAAKQRVLNVEQLMEDCPFPPEIKVQDGEWLIERQGVEILPESLEECLAQVKYDGVFSRGVKCY